MQLDFKFYLNSTGYSIASQESILSVRHIDPEFNIKATFLNVQADAGVSRNRRQIFAAMKATPPASEQVSLYQSIPYLYRRLRHAKKHIGFCVFETINPPKEWIKLMNEMDSILTATMFNKRIFEQAGVTLPITVIPHCFDPKMFNKDVKPNGRYDKTTFFAMGTWKNRKNWPTLIKAFYDAFEVKDNVCLLIKTDNPSVLEAEVMRIKRAGEWRSKRTAPIYTEKRAHCDFEDIPSIMKKGDIYVSTSLGEGFGISGMNAMALGIPVITPRFGGCLEYALPDLCTYINPKSYKTYRVMDGITQFNNCIWPVLSIGDTRDAMRSVYENFKDAEKKAAAAYKYVHNNFTYDVIGPKFIEAVSL